MAGNRYIWWNGQCAKKGFWLTPHLFPLRNDVPEIAVEVLQDPDLIRVF